VRVETSDTLNRRALSNLLFADIATAQELLRQVGSLSHIDLIVKPEDKAAIAAMLPTGVKLETAEAQKNAVQQMTAAFELNLTELALVVGMFLIYNTVTFSVIQRRPIFGILRCLGVTRATVYPDCRGSGDFLALWGVCTGRGVGGGAGAQHRWADHADHQRLLLHRDGAASHSSAKHAREGWWVPPLLASGLPAWKR